MSNKQKRLDQFEEHNLGYNTFYYQVDQLEQFLGKLGYFFISSQSTNSTVRGWHIRNIEKNDNPRYISLESCVRLYNGVPCRIGNNFTDCIGLKEKLWFTGDQWRAASKTREIVKVKLYKSAKDGWKVRDNYVRFI